MAAIPPWDWPTDIRQGLLDVLRDPAATAEELVLAAETAGNSVVVDDEVVGALFVLLRSEVVSEGVRSTAVISLGRVLELGNTDEFDDPASVPISAPVFQEIQKTLGALYRAPNVPKLVLRRILEASVRATQDWHAGAIRSAYASGDEEWRLTAVFGMRYVRGFDEQILAALKSSNPEIVAEAASAAGTWSIAAAWNDVVDIVGRADVDKDLLLAAITAVGEIRPREARAVLEQLEDSDDEEIADVVAEVLAMAGDWTPDELGDEEEQDLLS